MTIPVDVWLRGTDVAQTTSIESPEGLPADWTDEDVQRVLGGMLRAMYRQKFPDGGCSTKSKSPGQYFPFGPVSKAARKIMRFGNGSGSGGSAGSFA